jgi:hypothetical protein
MSAKPVPAIRLGAGVKLLGLIVYRHRSLLSPPSYHETRVSYPQCFYFLSTRFFTVTLAVTLFIILLNENTVKNIPVEKITCYLGYSSK